MKKVLVLLFGCMMLLSGCGGKPHLDKQLQKTIGLMQASDSWEEFDALFAKAMKQSNT